MSMPHRRCTRLVAAVLGLVVIARPGADSATAQSRVESVRYTYDAAGRLTAVSQPGADLVYTWDAAGNRTSALVTALTAPVVESLSPSAVAANTATPIHVRGRGFLVAGAGVPTITFLLAGNVRGTATGVAVLSDSEIVAVGPPLVGVPPASSPLVFDVEIAFPGRLPQTLSSACRSISNLSDTPGSDLDGDGMPDTWEAAHGTDLQVDDASLDPDVDGIRNIDEYRSGTLPRGGHVRYFAEGATSTFFDDRLALLNTTDATADVQLRFLKTTGATVAHELRLGPHTRASVDPKALPGLQKAEFSTVIESSQPIVADRTLSWDATGYGAHAETSVASPATEWYLAEGATHSGLELFYLIQNPNASPTTVTVRYLRPSPAPQLVRTYPVAANSRFNIWVDQEGPEFANADLSAVLTATRPVIVERAMYRDAPGQSFTAGHASAGITMPARAWFLAEGATGPYFDLFVLVANPNDRATQVRATYLLESGATLQKTYPVAANSRFNIWVDLEEFPDGSGVRPLADVAVSTMVESLDATVPIIVERALWWPGSFATWYEAHNSPGTTAPGTAWALAEGEVGGSRATETYVLVANTSAFAGQARVTVYFVDGTSESALVDLAPSSRTNVVPAALFAHTAGQTFGTVVESVDTGGGLPQIVVERAMYWDAGGVWWAAGTNAVATRLR